MLKGNGDTYGLCNMGWPIQGLANSVTKMDRDDTIEAETKLPVNPESKLVMTGRTLRSD